MHAAQALLRSLPHRPETPAPAPVEVVGLGAHLTGREENLSVRESLIITPLLQNRDSGYESGASCLTCSFPPASGDSWRVSLLALSESGDYITFSPCFSRVSRPRP